MKFNPRMLPRLKNWTTHKDFNPDIRVPTPLSAVENAVEVTDEFEDEGMNAE
jgi:hypothetical protein